MSSEYKLHHFSCQTDLSLRYRTFSLKLIKSHTISENAQVWQYLKRVFICVYMSSQTEFQLSIMFHT